MKALDIGLPIGALVAALPYAIPLPGNVVGTTMLCLSGMVIGGAWIALAGALRQYRGVNETISSLLLAYTAIALFKQLVEGPLRDPKTLNKPSTRSLVETLQIGGIAGSDVHWGLVLGVVACIGLGLWLAFTPGGFAVRVVGGNPRTAQLVGLPANRLILLACALGGAAAGLAGAVEVAAVHTNANASLIAGYGYAGILVAFIARQSPFAIIPVAILFGGFGAAGSLLQRRLGLPDASVQVLQGIAFVLILASESLRSVDWAAVAKKWRQRATPEPDEPAPPKDAIADSTSTPSRPRLMRPDFSVRHSPRLTKRKGAPTRRAPPTMPATSAIHWSAVIARPPSPAAPAARHGALDS